MSKIAEKRTDEIIGEFHDGDYTDHSRHNTQWVAFKQGYDQAMQDFVEKACVSFCKQCPWRCKYDITQGEYCKNLHDFKQILIQE